MAAAAPVTARPPSGVQNKLDRKPHPAGILAFILILLGGLLYAGYSIAGDLGNAREVSVWPYFLLGIALLTALGFEFVNGFHDTANAVATVIYTHSLEPHVAVVWSGFWNFIGVVLSSGAVAFTIISLLPVELILQVGNSAGFAMVFALLIAAIIWNLGTWYFGLPNSSSHTMIGSVIGVGIANQLMSVHTGTSGVDWNQAKGIGLALFWSPIIGFAMAFLLLHLLKAIIKDRRLYTAPAGEAPPPFWIRCLLILTCTGVSFFHGSNDGQKGMGLIMLILIGTVPTAYALNHAVTAQQSADFVASSTQTAATLSNHLDADAIIGDPHDEVTSYVQTHNFTPSTMLALRQLVNEMGNELSIYGELKAVPQDKVRNFRNDMYLVDTAIQTMLKAGKPAFNPVELKTIQNYKTHLDRATRFIPLWVKVVVALALGLGTMVGWKRIVVTVGERIGKDHLTYGQGAAAEITAMITIGMADQYHVPVSTTHVLSSAVGGTMSANGSGLQWATVRNLALAWVLTLPASMLLSGFLYWAFRSFGPK